MQTSGGGYIRARAFGAGSVTLHDGCRPGNGGGGAASQFSVEGVKIKGKVCTTEITEDTGGTKYSVQARAAKRELR